MIIFNEMEPISWVSGFGYVNRTLFLYVHLYLKKEPKERSIYNLIKNIWTSINLPVIKSEIQRTFILNCYLYRNNHM